MNKELLKSSRKIDAEFDQYRDTYDEQINQSLAFLGQSHDFFTKVKAEYLIKILCDEKLSNTKINALDIGCGHGSIHPYLLTQKKIDLTLSGVDVASTVIEMARDNNPNVTYQSYDGETLPYTDGSFDIAFAICVIHHVPPDKWEHFLQEMKRVVIDNGLIIIFEHNPLNPLTRKIVKNCPLDKEAVLISEKKMGKLMQSIGLKTIQSKFILFTPFDKPFFHKVDRILGWIPVGAQYYAFGRK